MGQRPMKEETRNQNLIKDYNSVMLDSNGKFMDFTYYIWEISSKYQISSQRMYEILDAYDVPRRNKNVENLVKDAQNAQS